MTGSQEAERICVSAADILRRCGVNAAASQTGGNTWCVAVSRAGEPLDDPTFIFGTAGDRWSAEVLDEPDGLWTDVASQEENATQVARGILGALTRWTQNQE